MPACSNCGNQVTPDYARVFTPGEDDVEVCPFCPDRIRDGSGWREARSTRRQKRGGYQ